MMDKGMMVCLLRKTQNTIAYTMSMAYTTSIYYSIVYQFSCGVSHCGLISHMDGQH